MRRTPHPTSSYSASRIGSSAPQSNFAEPSYTNGLLDSTITWAGTVADTLAHTSRHQLMASEFNVSAVNVPLKRSYSYGDSLDHITQMSLSHGLHGEIRQYTYTLAGELAGEQVDSLTSGLSCPPPVGQQLYDDGYSCTSLSGFVANHEFGFKYDSSGNRTESRDSVLGTVQTGTYAIGNRLTGWGGATYTRDLDGNDSTKTVGTQVTTYDWTADGRLASVTVGTVKLTYTYDAFGELIQRSRSTSGGAAVLERQFLWDQGQLLAELDSSATHRIAEYQYWPGSGQPFAIFTGADSITATRFFTEDAMNNVIGIFTTTGVAQSLVYEPFGLIDSTHSSFGVVADTSRLRWKGLMYEGDSTRLYYVRNRWYDAQAGRFLSEDPLGLRGGLNLYAFGGDDPVDFTDPFGTDADEDGDCTSVKVKIYDSSSNTTTYTTVRLCVGNNGGTVIDQIVEAGVVKSGRAFSAPWGTIYVPDQNWDYATFDHEFFHQLQWDADPLGMAFNEGIDQGLYSLGMSSIYDVPTNASANYFLLYNPEQQATLFSLCATGVSCAGVPAPINHITITTDPAPPGQK